MHIHSSFNSKKFPYNRNIFWYLVFITTLSYSINSLVAFEEQANEIDGNLLENLIHNNLEIEDPGNDYLHSLNYNSNKENTDIYEVPFSHRTLGFADFDDEMFPENMNNDITYSEANKTTIFVKKPNDLEEALKNASRILNHNSDYNKTIAEVYLFPNITYNLNNSLNIEILSGLLFLATINTTSDNNGIYNLHDDSTLMSDIHPLATINVTNVNDKDTPFIFLKQYGSIDIRYVEFNGNYCDPRKLFQFIEYTSSIESDDLLDVGDDDLFTKPNWVPGKINMVNVHVNGFNLENTNSYFIKNFFALNMVQCKIFNNRLQSIDVSSLSPSTFISSVLEAWRVTIVNTSFYKNQIQSNTGQQGVHTMIYLESRQTCNTYNECSELNDGMQSGIFIMKNSSIEYNIINGTGSSVVWLSTSFNPFFQAENPIPFKIMYNTISNNLIYQESLQCNIIFGVSCATVIVATPYYLVSYINPSYQFIHNNLEDNTLKGGANLLTFTNPSGETHIHRNKFESNNMHKGSYLIYIFESSEDIEIHDNIFSNSIIREQSILILIENPGRSLEIKRNQLLNNSLSSSGGIVINTPTTTTIDYDKFIGNTVTNGVLLLINYPQGLTINHFVFEANVLSASGLVDNFITSSSFGDNERTDAGLIIVIDSANDGDGNSDSEENGCSNSNFNILNGTVKYNVMEKHSILMGFYKPASKVSLKSTTFISNWHKGNSTTTIYVHQPANGLIVSDCIFDRIYFNSSINTFKDDLQRSFLINVYQPTNLQKLSFLSNDFTNIFFDMAGYHENTKFLSDMTMSIFNINMTSNENELGAVMKTSMDMTIQNCQFDNIQAYNSYPLIFNNQNGQSNINFSSCLFNRIQMKSGSKSPLYFSNKEGMLNLVFSNCTFTNTLSQGNGFIYVNGSDDEASSTHFTLTNGRFESNLSPQGSDYIYLQKTTGFSCSYYSEYDDNTKTCVNATTAIPRYWQTYMTDSMLVTNQGSCNASNCEHPPGTSNTSHSTSKSSEESLFIIIFGLVLIVIVLLFVNPNVRNYIKRVKTTFIKNLEKRRRENMTEKQLEALINMYGEQLKSKKKASIRDSEVDVSLAFMKGLPQQLQLPYSCLKLGGVIGKGGSGVVLKAKMHKRVDVAVKIISSQLSGDMEEIRQELSMLYKTNHPSITRFYGVTFKEGAILMIQEYCPLNLEQYIQEESKEKHIASLGAFLSIAIPVTDALEFLHGKGIAHRDIKPQNILLDFDLKPKLCDLGMAKVINGKESRELNNLFDDIENPSEEEENSEGIRQSETYKHVSARKSAFITFQTKDAAGTPGYMPPELLSLESGMKYSPLRWDVFSLSMCFYFMYSGEHPLASYDNFFLITDEIQKGTRPLLPTNMPLILKDLVRLMWDQNPHHRPNIKMVSDTLDEMELDLNLENGDTTRRSTLVASGYTVKNPINEFESNTGYEDSQPSQELVSTKKR